MVAHIVSTSPERSKMEFWSYPMVLPPDVPLTIWSHMPDRLHALANSLFTRKVVREDARITEILQATNAQFAGRHPLFGLYDKRILSFYEAYPAAINL